MSQTNHTSQTKAASAQLAHTMTGPHDPPVTSLDPPPTWPPDTQDQIGLNMLRHTKLPEFTLDTPVDTFLVGLDHILNICQLSDVAKRRTLALRLVTHTAATRWYTATGATLGTYAQLCDGLRQQFSRQDLSQELWAQLRSIKQGPRNDPRTYASDFRALMQQMLSQGLLDPDRQASLLLVILQQGLESVYSNTIDWSAIHTIGQALDRVSTLQPIRHWTPQHAYAPQPERRPQQHDADRRYDADRRHQPPQFVGGNYTRPTDRQNGRESERHTRNFASPDHTERERRRANHLCYYCGENDHAAQMCPRRRQPAGNAKPTGL